VSYGHLLIGLGQAAQDVTAVAVKNERARRYGNDKILAAPAMTVVRTAGAALLGPPVLAMDDVGQAVRPGHGANNHAAAVAAGAAASPAARYVLPPPEAATAAAAIAALDVECHAIHEHHHLPASTRKNEPLSATDCSPILQGRRPCREGNRHEGKRRNKQAPSGSRGLRGEPGNRGLLIRIAIGTRRGRAGWPTARK